MDLLKLDTELNVKIIETLKTILKDINIQIKFEIPDDELIEGSVIELNDKKFILFKNRLITNIEELNPKYKKFIRKKTINNIQELNQHESIEYIKKHTKYLFLLRLFLGKKIITKELETVIFKINFNNIIVKLEKQEYDKLNYYTKYIYKLQQLYKLNKTLGINQTIKIIFDDDVIISNLYNSMYIELSDIIKPPIN